MSSMNYPVVAAMSNRPIPQLKNYVLRAATASTFSIELIDGDGRTLDYYVGVSCPASSSTLRSLLVSHNANAGNLIEQAVGAYLRTNAEIIYYNTSVNPTTGVASIPAAVDNVRNFAANTLHTLGWA